MRAGLTVAIALVALLTTSAQSRVERPRILGISHLAVFVRDPGAAGRFYDGLLGLRPAPVQGASGRVRMHINDGQWVELVPGPGAGEGQLEHVAFRVDDVARMRAYLVDRGIAAEDVSVAGSGERRFFVTDPDGHRIEFVQQERLSSRSPSAGSPAGRTVSDRALHVGILVGDLARANAFYRDMLGFAEIWRGNAVTSKTLSWVNMRVPDGTDYLEFMLYAEKPAPDRRGTAHHLCLLVPDAAKAVAALEARREASGYTRPIEIRVGVNRKRQVNLFDPDGTRVELMEPDTVDGVPAPSSTLPPPR